MGLGGDWIKNRGNGRSYTSTSWSRETSTSRSRETRKTHSREKHPLPHSLRGRGGADGGAETRSIQSGSAGDVRLTVADNFDSSNSNSNGDFSPRLSADAFLSARADLHTELLAQIEPIPRAVDSRETVQDLAVLISESGGTVSPQDLVNTAFYNLSTGSNNIASRTELRTELILGIRQVMHIILKFLYAHL